MPKVICAVYGCSNGTYRMNKWKKSVCEVHPNILHEDCGCLRPFHLHCFPSVLSNSERRKLWVQAIKRDTVDGKAWQPTDGDRVCSDHFKDGQPTSENPLPTLKLGYKKRKKNQGGHLQELHLILTWK